MRTCPACGKETGAGMSESCTKCGFSPGEPDDATFESVGEPLEWTPAPAPPPGEKPEPLPEGRPAKKRTGWGRGIFVLVLVAAAITDAVDNGEEDFEDPGNLRYPAKFLEIDIEADAAFEGIFIDVKCPGAVTSEGDRVECTASNSVGDKAPFWVETTEGGVEWSMAPLRRLQRLEDRALGR